MNHEDQNNTGPTIKNAYENLSQQYPSSKGGMSTDILCPSCREEICGFYLPTFRCPHCSSMIWRDEEGNVTNSEYHQACPECGHIFRRVENLLFESDFRKAARKVEDFVLGLDSLFARAAR